MTVLHYLPPVRKGFCIIITNLLLYLQKDEKRNWLFGKGFGVPSKTNSQNEEMANYLHEVRFLGNIQNHNSLLQRNKVNLDQQFDGTSYRPHGYR